MGRLFYTLALQTDPIWVSQDVTAYADDFHAGSLVRSHRDLRLLETCLGCLLQVWVDAGMKINALKSAIYTAFEARSRTCGLRHLRTFYTRHNCVPS